MATQLRVDSQDGRRTCFLEIAENQPINANYQFKDIQDFANNKGSHTYNFRVPSTTNNDLFFNQYFEVTQFGNYNPKLKVPATIQKDGLDVFTGFLKLTNVYCKHDNEFTYECVVFNNIGQLGQLLSSKKLSSFDWSYLDHVMTIDLIKDSMNRDEAPFVKAGNIVYSLFDYGVGMIMDGSVGAINNPDTPIDIRKLKPQTRVKYIFNQIMTQIGYTYTSTFIDSHLADLYMDLNNGSSTITSVNQRYYEVSASENESSLQTFVSAPYQDIVIEAPTIESNPSGMWDASTSIFDPPSFFTEVFLYFGVTLDVAGTGLTSQSTFRLCIWEVDASGNLDDLVEAFPIQPIYDELTGFFSFIQFTGQWSFDNTKRYKFTLAQYDTGGSDGETLTMTATGLWMWSTANPGDPSYNLIGEPSLDATYTFEAGLNMPDIKAIDFVTSLCKKYNLVVLPDEFDETHFYIEPYKNWIKEGSVKDWTAKLDTSKDVQLKPTTSLQAKVLLFEDKNIEDAWNTSFNQSAGRKYGSVEIDNDNDFGKANETIDTIFAPTITRYIYGSAGIKNTICYKEPDQTAKGNRLSWYCGYQYADNGFDPIYITDNVISSNIGQYAVLQNWKDAQPTATSECVTFQGEFTYEMNYPATSKGAYNVYWRDFIEETYSRDSRMLIGNFLLNSVDIMSLNFNDIIFVKNEYFRINKISNYPLMGEGVCKVELIKIQRAVDIDPLLLVECNVGWTGIINNNGIAVFNSYTNWGGTPVIPSEGCCLQAGFFFYDGNCHWLQKGQMIPPQIELQNKTIIGGNNGMLGQMNHVLGHNNNVTSHTNIKGSNNNMGGSTTHVSIAGDKNRINGITKNTSIEGNHNLISPYTKTFKGTRLNTFVAQEYTNTKIIGDYGVSLGSGDVFLSGGADSLYNEVGRSGSGHFVRHVFTTGEESILVGQKGKFTIDTSSAGRSFATQGDEMFRLQFPSCITYEMTIAGHNRGTSSQRSQLYSFRKYSGVIDNTNNSGNIIQRSVTKDISKESSDFTNYSLTINNGSSRFEEGEYIDDGMFCFKIDTNTCSSLDIVDWTIDFRYTLVGLQNLSRTSGQVIFDPTSISGCLLWVDSADEGTITHSSGSVSKWDDKSGNNHHLTQSTASYEPTYSNNLFTPYIAFDGNNQVLANTDANLINVSDSTNTMFVVFKSDNTTTSSPGEHLAGVNYRGRQYYGMNINSTTASAGGTAFMNSSSQDYDCNLSSIASTTIQVICGTRDGTDRIIYDQDGNTDTETDSLNTLQDMFSVGATWETGRTPTADYTGKIYEIIVWDNVLTDAQREQVFNYLQTKWNT